MDIEMPGKNGFVTSNEVLILIYLEISLLL